ncbi:MAG TPA: hypothetical protein VN875_00215 [Candidatus Binatus sp.]|jgi:hypothetical protein|nr:hypothetical protein [Candidatus Binatus sp.]
MRMLKQALGVLGAFVVLAVIVAFVAPNRARAVAATLVQIVPGNTTHVGQAEGQLVSLFCPDDYSYCLELDGKGGYSSTTAYAVPSGHTLIVTDYQFFVFGNNSSIAGAFGGDSFLGPDGVLGDAITINDKNGDSGGHEHYASGIRVSSGVTIYDTAASHEVGYAYIQGYLVPNE